MIASGHHNTFPKAERLSGKKNIEELFQKGSSFYLFPFLLKYNPSGGTENRFLVSVSKKKFKRAKDRNTIKRRVKEAYRLNKFHLASSDTFYNLAVIYLDQNIRPFQEIEPKLVELLIRLKSLNATVDEK